MWAKYFSEQNLRQFSGGNLHFPAVTSFNYSDNLPNWHYPWHMHKASIELLYVQQGQGYISLPNGRSNLTRGDIAVIPAGMGHQLLSDSAEPFCYYTLRILLHPGSGSLGSGAPELPIDFIPPDGPLLRFFAGLPFGVTVGLNCLDYVEKTFQLLLTLYEMNGGMDETMQALLFSLLTLTRKLFENKMLTARMEEGYSMSDVIQYINEHSAEPLTLQSIADHFHLSPSHLSRLFSKAYHSSPINYLISVRLANASDLLISTRRSISEIAALVGYDNFSHFNVLFRKRIGCTPHEFRTRNTSPGARNGRNTVMPPDLAANPAGLEFNDYHKIELHTRGGKKKEP